MSMSLRFGYFYLTLPLIAAERRGFYRNHGLDVAYDRVRSSTQQFEYLRDGRYDVVQTSPDNVANYRYNSQNPLGERIDVQGFMGMDYGLNLVLVAHRDIATIEDLRGRVVAVDALESGFAYVLYAILAGRGLKRDEDYAVVPVGGVAQRFESLVGDGHFSATLLSGGYETRAANAGYRLLAAVGDIADPYVGAWAAATSSWLSGNPNAAASLVVAYREATAWCFRPGNRDECVAMLMEVPDTPRALADQLYDIQILPGVGNVPDAGMVIDGVRNVLALRRRFGGFEADVDPEVILSEGALYRVVEPDSVARDDKS